VKRNLLKNVQNEITRVYQELQNLIYIELKEAWEGERYEKLAAKLRGNHESLDEIRVLLRTIIPSELDAVASDYDKAIAEIRRHKNLI